MLPLCAKNHRTERCTSDVSLEDKRSMLRKDGRCFKCTTKGHLVRDCHRRIECTACKRRHASTMCNAEVNESSPSSAPEKTPDIPRHVETNGATPQIADEIFFQTFRAWLTTSTHCCYVHGVLDNGSQRTFLRDDVCKKLKLPSIREMDLVISTFGRA
ncbi:hypothetical protein HPB49_014410 [Dermacentor silvarum]|uniref:Uncharacterized protein n=1 Tax=Dermacentor silvarum TaxID=543639 RepID=A0ACB8CFN8_DERSI|nr:hypothetical protein HPB49_014410 [Dermacentor silvarum]